MIKDAPGREERKGEGMGGVDWMEEAVERDVVEDVWRERGEWIRAGVDIDKGDYTHPHALDSPSGTCAKGRRAVAGGRRSTLPVGWVRGSVGLLTARSAERGRPWSLSFFGQLPGVSTCSVSCQRCANICLNCIYGSGAV